MPRPLLLASLLLLPLAARAQQAPAPADTLPHLPRLAVSGLLTADQLPALAPTIQDQLRRVPGVQVTPFSGAPGADAVLRVRSAASLLHPTQPLFEVGGLPTLALTFGLAGSQASFGIPSRDFNPLLLLPPGVLDSVQVQTGAAATARYGILGAGGVLGLHSATGGGSRPLQVSYQGQVTAQQLRRAYSLLGAREFAELSNEAQAYSGSNVPYYSAAELEQLGRGTDWQRELYGLGLGTDHQLRLRGQQGDTRYAAQLGYLRQEGIMRNSRLNRYHAGLAVDQRLGPHLDLHANVLGTQLQERQPTPTAVTGALLSVPTVPVRDASGEYSSFLPPGKPGFLSHPLQEAEGIYAAPRTRLLLTRLAATYRLGADWQLSLRGGYDQVTQDSPDYGLAYTGSPQPGVFRYASQRLGEREHGVKTLAGTATARYEHRFGLQHRVAASLEYGYQRLRYDAAAHYQYPGGPGGGANDLQFALDNYHSRLHYQRATASYTLRDAYEWQVSLWTNRWDQRQFYPGGQFTWRAERLPALQAASWLSELHAWAAAGQAATGLYDGYFVVTGPTIFISPGQPAPPIPPAEYFNNGPRQGRTTHLELGATLGLWQQRLRLGLTAYQRRSRDLPVPELFFYQNYPYIRLPNALGLQNRGLELTLESRWQTGRLRGQTRLAAATSRNEVTQAPELPYFRGVNPGQQLGSFVGSQQVGIYPDGPRAGLIQYQSTPQSGNFPAYDLPLGGGAPHHTLSLFQRLTWGRLALDVQADAMGGYRLFNETLRRLEVPTGLFNSSTAVRDRWTPTHQQTSTPRAGTLVAQQSAPIDNRYLSNGAHLRLTEVVLSYRLPTALPLTVYGGGRNLLVLTGYRGYDPNVSSGGADANQPMFDQGAYPVPRTWLLGVNAEF
jgi:hypothetical protein